MRVYRIWRREGLRVSAKQPERLPSLLKQGQKLIWCLLLCGGADAAAPVLELPVFVLTKTNCLGDLFLDQASCVARGANHL